MVIPFFFDARLLFGRGVNRLGRSEMSKLQTVQFTQHDKLSGK
jgi:hypothetical protein